MLLPLGNPTAFELVKQVKEGTLKKECISTHGLAESIWSSPGPL